MYSVLAKESGRGGDFLTLPWPVSAFLAGSGPFSSHTPFSPINFPNVLVLLCGTLCVESKVVLIVITGGVSVVPPVAAVYN
jgi:hypothetical protein